MRPAAGWCGLACKALGLVAMLPGDVSAHGFAQRYDLPVPLGLYLTGAATAVALSFVVVALFVRGERTLRNYPRLDLLGGRIGRLLAGPWLVGLVMLMSFAALVLIIAGGFLGPQDAFRNIAPTAIWVIWWVGFAYICGLLGNLWALVNPWSSAYAAAERIWTGVFPGRKFGLGLRWPAGLGCWPAVLLFACFVWAELIWPESDHPASLARAALLYSLLTWLGMFLFGRREWLRGGETFSVLYAFLARFAPTEAGNGSLYLRPWAVGLLTDKPIALPATVFVLLMLSSVTFDGLLATPLWAAVAEWMLHSEELRPLIVFLQDFAGDAIAAIGTIALVVFLLCFQLLFFLFCALIRWCVPRERRGEFSVIRVAGLFVLSLVPIALAYHLAHYLSYLAIVGQYIIPILSDPFGLGWNLFGTRLYVVDISVINAKTVWYTSVIAIVTGHIIAVWLSHVMALRALGDNRAALRSQVPMLLLMVAYTTLSLWILAQPVVETS